uniref:Transposase n=1 Tax=Steinernema glaseri TaxID=37863 RepID=A0A1I7Y7P0_9BILA
MQTYAYARKFPVSWGSSLFFASQIRKAARLQDYALADQIFRSIVFPDLAAVFRRKPSRWQSPLDDPEEAGYF